MEAKELRLSLKTKWFEMTKAGIKTEDYREINAYWVKRLTKISDKQKAEKYAENLLKGKDVFPNDYGNGYRPDYCFPKEFIANTMTLGYPKSGDKERTLKLEHLGIEIREGNPEWGAEPGKLYFVIKHGKIIE